MKQASNIAILYFRWQRRGTPFWVEALGFVLGMGSLVALWIGTPSGWGG